MRILQIGVLLAFLGMTFAGCGRGVETTLEEASSPEGSTAAAAEEVITASIDDLDSPICQVPGIDLRQAGIGATTSYEGKLYGFSCPGCKKSFLEDPESYLAKAQDELEAVESLTLKSPAADKDTEPAAAETP